jgi:hypothetical protein
MADGKSPPPPANQGERQVKIISHADLFYWWPVWAVAFLMALLTYADEHVMAVVPKGTVAEKALEVPGHEGPRDVLVLPAGKGLPADPETGAPLQPHLPVARSNSLGAVFATVLLLVTLITNVRLRGVWSLVVILSALFLSILFAFLGWWDNILHFMLGINIHITSAGYLFIATVLFAFWMVVFLFFDRLVYVTFRRGQFRTHLAVGTGETAYEVLGMVLDKKRDDLFRHWVLGFGSGDLIVKTGGSNPQTIELPNVLFVGHKLEQAEQMLQEREVVPGQRR